MSQHEFVIAYVAVPLAVALGWLLWRARYFLRNAVLYTLAVAALLAVIRVGQLALGVWERAGAAPTEQGAPMCGDPSAPRGGADGSCWT